MIRSKYTTLLLLPVVFCALVTTLSGQLQSRTAKTDEEPEKLKAWEFPDADRSHRRGTVGDISAADYATPKPFEDVWAYYAKKLGYTDGYRPNLTYGKSSSGADGQYQIMILNSSDKPSAVRVTRPTAKSATLIRRGAGGNVTIFISRAKDEDKTYFTLIVEGK